MAHAAADDLQRHVSWTKRTWLVTESVLDRAATFECRERFHCLGFGMSHFVDAVAHKTNSRRVKSERQKMQHSQEGRVEVQKKLK